MLQGYYIIFRKIRLCVYVYYRERKRGGGKGRGGKGERKREMKRHCFDIINWEYNIRTYMRLLISIKFVVCGAVKKKFPYRGHG